MKFDYIGAGLGLAALGLALMLALPPPWWPKMPDPLVQFCIALGVVLFTLGIAITGIGTWPGLPNPKGPYAVILLGSVALFSGFIWLLLAKGSGSLKASSSVAIQTAVPPPVLAQPNSIKMPSILTLYMTDFAHGGGSGGGLLVKADGTVDLDFEDHAKLRLYYRVTGDTGNMSKFLAVYIPFSTHTYDAIGYLVNSYRPMLAVPPFAAGSTRESLTTSDQLIFTGRIFVYYEVPLSLEQLGTLAGLFKASGVSVEFRSWDYAVNVMASIKAGDVKQPPDYEIVDGLPKLVTPTN